MLYVLFNMSLLLFYLPSLSACTCTLSVNSLAVIRYIKIEYFVVNWNIIIIIIIIINIIIIIIIVGRDSVVG